MKIVFLGLVGLFLGAMLGGVLGVIFGLVYVHVTHTIAREGFAGMVVFFTFMPLGILLGGAIGAVGLGYLATRDVSPRWRPHCRNRNLVAQLSPDPSEI